MSTPSLRMRAAMAVCVTTAGFKAIAKESAVLTLPKLHGEVLGMAFAEAEAAYDRYQQLLRT